MIRNPANHTIQQVQEYPPSNNQDEPIISKNDIVYTDQMNSEHDNFNQRDAICQFAMDKSIRKEMESSQPNLDAIYVQEVDEQQNSQTIQSKQFEGNNEHKDNQDNIIDDDEDDENFLSADNERKQQRKQQDQRWKKFNFSFNVPALLQLFFIDYLKLLLNCSKYIKETGVLQLKHIPFLRPNEKVENNYQIFQKIMDRKIKENLATNRKLTSLDMLGIILRTFYSPITKMVLSVLAYYSLKIFFSSCISFLIKAVVKDDSTSVIYGWAVVMSVTQIVYVSLVHHSVRFFTRFFTQFRAIFNRALFLKVSSLSQFSIKEANVGKLVNLVSNDLNLLEMKSYSIISLLTLPPPIIAVALILYYRFDAYALIGLAVMIGYIPFQLLLAKLSSGFFKNKAQLVDQRVKFTNEVIEGIRLIKMYAWEEAFVHLVSTIRKAELRKILIIQFIFILEHSFSFVSGLFASYITFYCIYNNGNANNLNVANMYSTFDLLQYVKQQVVSSAGFGITGLLELKVILERMITVVTIQSSKMTCLDRRDLQKGEIQMKNFTGFWKENRAVLNNITMDIKKGECIGIVGKVGSGKSSLLSCLLKEIPKYKGYFQFNGKIAYVEQEPYIFSKTLKENIIFGSKYDETFYNEVLDACCLMDDIKLFDCGDQTQIGERGINISGGQKARISLARALYSKADIYLLDDPLSAVDSKVAKYLFENAIQKVLKGKTVLLVTHQIPFTRNTDRIIIMNEGYITQSGTFLELQDSLQELSNQMHLNDQSSHSHSRASHSIKKDLNNDEDNDENEEEEQQQEEIVVEQVKEDKNNQVKQGTEIVKKKDNLFTKEEDEGIVVNSKTYLKYFGYSKIWYLVPLMFLSFMSCEVVYVFYSQIIGLYDNIGENHSDVISLLGYLSLTYFINLILKYSLLTLTANSSSYNIHNQMIKSLLHSTVLYFDRTPSGRILNRFSSDLGIIDQDLTKTSMDTIEIICSFCILMGTIIAINPYFAIIGAIQIIILGLFLNVSKRVLVSSKQIDLRYKSPVYTFFNQTTQGVLPIRIYEKEQLFCDNFDFLMNNSLRSSFAYWYNSRAFGYYVNMVTTISAIIGIFMVLSINQTPSSLGQTIVYFLSISDSIQWGLRQMIQTDVAMSSAQRAMNMTLIEQEPSLRTQYDEKMLKTNNNSSKSDSSTTPIKQGGYQFPTQGNITFNNVKMRYRKDLNYVLNGLSFQLKGGEKVGCVGRTGAGKSSIIQALFRMTEIERDDNDIDQNELQKITNDDMGIIIDGHNISNLGLHTLRGGISIIPQVPFIFSGTIRRNLDPLNEFSDEQIKNILQDISLKDKVDSLEKGLYTDMTNASEIFSTGQKQLICLGRAILRKSKLIVLDEATANCDMFTDELIQSKIREKFADSTLITVAHRLNTIADYDRVIVVDKGRVIEQGSPYELLNNSNGIFTSMVNHTGKKNARHIYQLAKQAYSNKKLQ